MVLPFIVASKSSPSPSRSSKFSRLLHPGGRRKQAKTHTAEKTAAEQSPSKKATSSKQKNSKESESSKISSEMDAEADRIEQEYLRMAAFDADDIPECTGEEDTSYAAKDESSGPMPYSLQPLQPITLDVTTDSMPLSQSFCGKFEYLSSGSRGMSSSPSPSCLSVAVESNTARQRPMSYHHPALTSTTSLISPSTSSLPRTPDSPWQRFPVMLWKAYKSQKYAGHSNVSSDSAGDLPRTIASRTHSTGLMGHSTLLSSPSPLPCARLRAKTLNDSPTHNRLVRPPRSLHIDGSFEAVCLPKNKLLLQALPRSAKRHDDYTPLERSWAPGDKPVMLLSRQLTVARGQDLQGVTRSYSLSDMMANKCVSAGNQHRQLMLSRSSYTHSPAASASAAPTFLTQLKVCLTILLR